MPNTSTIEAIDLAAYDWTPCCEVETSVLRGGTREVVDKCDAPADLVIEVRHCTPYRLFACTPCATRVPPQGWVCRRCGALYPAPLVIGKAS